MTGLVFASMSACARADDLVYLDRSDRGFNLPGVTLPQGQDEVHAADGTTCRSAVGGSGSYLDVGAIKDSLGTRGSEDVATYARVVIPLGTRSSRLDCAKLYALEVERLELELRLLKMGIAPKGAEEPAAAPAAASGHWTRDGWTDSGITGGIASGAARQAAKPQPRRAEADGSENALGLY